MYRRCTQVVDLGRCTRASEAEVWQSMLQLAIRDQELLFVDARNDESLLEHDGLDAGRLEVAVACRKSDRDDGNLVRLSSPTSGDGICVELARHGSTPRGSVFVSNLRRDEMLAAHRVERTRRDARRNRRYVAAAATSS